MVGMTMTRTRTPRAELTDVYVDSPSIVESAMRGDGRYAVKLSTGHTVMFSLEGDYLVGRVTPEQAKLLKEMSVFEVEGFERKVDPLPTTRSFIAEGKRLHAEKQGQGGKSSGSDAIGDLFKSMGLEGILGDRMAALMADRVEKEAQARVDARFKADEERRVAANGEFGFARITELLTEDQIIGVFNEFLPEFDASAMPPTARVSLLARSAPADRTLQLGLRELLGEYISG